MWQIMHWLEGMERVKTCLIGCPDSFFGIPGSEEALKPEWPKGAYAPEYLARYEAAFAAAREESSLACGQFSQLAAERPDDPLVHFYLERNRSGESGIHIKMTEK